MPLYASQVSVSGHICSLDQSVGSHGDCFESGGQYINGLMVHRVDLHRLSIAGRERGKKVCLEYLNAVYIALHLIRPFVHRPLGSHIRNVLEKRASERCVDDLVAAAYSQYGFF